MQFAIYGSNGIVTDQTQASTYASMYGHGYFVGLQMVYNVQFLLSPISFDIVNDLSSNLYYFSSEVLFVASYCPSNFPIIDSTRSYCLSGCLDSYYPRLAKHVPTLLISTATNATTSQTTAQLATLLTASSMDSFAVADPTVSRSIVLFLVFRVIHS
ncbi:unnamed protein product [Sphagnum balticum]